MKGKIKNYLVKNALWKQLIKEEEKSLKNVSLINLDIIVYEKKDLKVFFETSVVYRILDDVQKQTFSSAVAVINEVGNVIKVCSNNLVLG